MTPSRPTLLIQPRGREAWRAYLSEVWRYRELVMVLTWRDLKLRYKQTALGVAWVFLQPLASILIFTIFFGRLARIPSDGIPYPLFAFAGLLPWTYFANVLQRGSQSLVSHSHLVTKIYFPRLCLPGAAVLSAFVDYALGFGLLIGMFLFWGVTPAPQAVIAVPLLTLLLALLAFATATWLSALNVRYRDVTHVLPYLVQLWMYATPIVYPTSLVPHAYRWLMGLNPLAGIIEAYRSALFGKPCDWLTLAVSASVVVVGLVLSLLYFNHLENSFADVI